MKSNVFTGIRSKWLTLYEELKELVEEETKNFTVHETIHSIQWKHTSVFVDFSATQYCMRISLVADEIHDDWCANKVVRTSKNRVSHTFEIEDNSRLLDMREYIQVAYQVTKSNKPVKQQEETPEYHTIDEYIALFEGNVKDILLKTREVIKKAAPDAKEKISWQMPTFYYHENVIHFAAGKNHLGIYPGASGVEAFLDKLGGYKTSKGAIQFPFHKEIPYDLITEIVTYRMQEIEEKHK